MTFGLAESGDGGGRRSAFVEEIASGDEGYAMGPERDLLSALLFDGVQSYLNYANSSASEARSRYREACAWIYKKGDEYIFSFDSVCEGLGIDPDYLRSGLASVTSAGVLKGKRRSTRL